jgi:hypothetical protein
MKLRFGGPTFPETFAGGRMKTWFYDLGRPLADGTYAQTVVYFGDEVALERVLNAQEFVDRGMATVVECDETASAELVASPNDVSA